MSLGKLLRADEDMGSKLVASRETVLKQVKPDLTLAPALSHRKPSAPGKYTGPIEAAMLQRTEATVCCD